VAHFSTGLDRAGRASGERRLAAFSNPPLERLQ
jgi:hypothetical protein